MIAQGLFGPRLASERSGVGTVSRRAGSMPRQTGELTWTTQALSVQLTALRIPKEEDPGPSELCRNNPSMPQSLSNLGTMDICSQFFSSGLILLSNRPSLCLFF